MKKLMHPETTKYVICHNGNDVFHYSVVGSNDGLTTGQPFIEVFDSEEEAREAFPHVFPDSKIENQDSFLKEPE